MASLYVWKGNGATVCRFHRTPSDWDHEPLSAIETRKFVRMLQSRWPRRGVALRGLRDGLRREAAGRPLDLRRSPADRIAATIVKVPPVGPMTRRLLSLGNCRPSR